MQLSFMPLAINQPASDCKKRYRHAEKLLKELVYVVIVSYYPNFKEHLEVSHELNYYGRDGGSQQRG